MVSIFPQYTWQPDFVLKNKNVFFRKVNFLFVPWDPYPCRRLKNDTLYSLLELYQSCLVQPIGYGMSVQLNSPALVLSSRLKLYPTAHLHGSIRQTIQTFESHFQHYNTKKNLPSSIGMKPLLRPHNRVRGKP